MTKNISILVLLLAVVFSGCSKGDKASVTPATGPASSGIRGNPGGGSQPGVITAGEWSDLENWTFWNGLITRTNYTTMPSVWSIYNNNRIAVKVTGTDNNPVVDMPVQLKRDGSTIFTARTNNKGVAELWADLFQSAGTLDLARLTIDVGNGIAIDSSVVDFRTGINEVTIAPSPVDNKIELAFVVDATGSMGDELEYLKTELLDVINRAGSANPNASISTAAVFYRDESDEYITRVSNFTSDPNTTLAFIRKQSAGGGGDFPEAVHTALDKAINELQWSGKARARLMFLVLDAPPHNNSSVLASLQTSIARAAANGIRIIPVTASGIDKETEFLMRFMSISTNGTYVFITDDSGVGNDHLEATVGGYNVEYLNDLLVRLINKYAL